MAVSVLDLIPAQLMESIPGPKAPITEKGNSSS
jgi:hypothetical protein